MGKHHDELDLLDQAQQDAERLADDMGITNEVDRRHFVFISLATAAASTFGFGARAMAQGVGGRGGAPGQGQQPQAPPVPLDNMEGVSWTFQPYPGGTGALLEKTYREKGVAAFERQPFAWTKNAKGAFYIAPWGSAPLPSSDEEIAFLPAHRLAAAIKAGKLTSTRLTKIYLERLKRLNPTLLCAVTIMEEQGLADAARMDEELKAGKYRGPLHGIPWGVKDLFAVKGTPTTWGAQDFDTRVIDEDSEVVVRIREAGGVLIAKLATGQFAQGGTWYRGTTKNPWNLSRSSSGSSAGPASGTAAGCVAFGIGTETSGSITSPTTECGLSALRPTFGRVSRYGGMVLAWSQDRVGPITRTVEDAAMVFNVIHGASEKDPGTITMPFHFDSNIDLAGVRVGVRAQRNPDANLDAFVAKLKELGARTHELQNPPTVPGSQGGINVESAAAFDSYVQMKAKELGMDMETVLTTFGRQNRGGGGRAGGPSGPGAPGGGGGGAPPIPDSKGGQLQRWVPGRVPQAFDFINSQRRRLMLITAWQEYLRNTDVYVGGNGDVGVHAQTGHPVAVLPVAFAVPQVRGGFGGGARPDSTRPAAPPAPLNPQPICYQVAGNLYLDDVVLSVAHKYQVNTDWLKEHPKLG